jgi:hypothetical protein
MGRSYYYNGFRLDAPPLGYPPLERASEAVRIPEDWAVWAVTDIHGASGPFRAALVEAGLTNADGHWQGGPGVALLSIGDAIDRGPDSAGVVRHLRELAGEMAFAGSRLVLVRGNHEQMLADILRGCDEWFESWRVNGGEALARSFGLPPVGRDFRAFLKTLNDVAPDLLPWLLESLPYARWRDVLFVHAGLPRQGTLGTLLISDGQLWDPESWFISGTGLALEPDLWAFRDHGVRRLVIGHYPQDHGPEIQQDGTLMLLDSNAAGLPTLSGGPRTSFVTLARIPPEGSLEESDFVLVDASAGDGQPRR